MLVHQTRSPWEARNHGRPRGVRDQARECTLLSVLRVLFAAAFAGPWLPMFSDGCSRCLFLRTKRGPRIEAPVFKSRRPDSQNAARSVRRAAFRYRLFRAKEPAVTRLS